MLPLQTEEVLSPTNPRRHHATGWVLHRCGGGVWVSWCGDTRFTLPRLVYALESMLCMLSQHRAIGLQADCMMTVLAPMVEAARLPCACPMALGYGLPPL